MPTRYFSLRSSPGLYNIVIKVDTESSEPVEDMRGIYPFEKMNNSYDMVLKVHTDLIRREPAARVNLDDLGNIVLLGNPQGTELLEISESKRGAEPHKSEHIGYLFSLFGVGRFVKCIDCGAEQAELYGKLSQPKVQPINPYFRELFPDAPDTLTIPSNFRGNVKLLYTKDIPWPYRQTCIVRSCDTVLVEGANPDIALWIPHPGRREENQ